MSLHTAGHRDRTRRVQSESGAVALLVALMIPMLLVFLAVAVDISRWYVDLQRMQRAADAAALAAAPYMPENLAPGGPGNTAALDAVERNGFLRSEATVNKVPGSKTKVSVTISRSVSNFFSPIIGIATTELSRTGVADFASPVAIGSPCNLFGREDMEPIGNQRGSIDCASAGTYWVNIAGTYTNKARGDGYSSSWCTKPDDGVGIDRCQGTPVVADWSKWTGAPAPGTNLDWWAKEPATTAPDFKGYVFIVRVKDPGTLALQGYDIGWVATGDNCEDGTTGLLGVTSANAYVTAAEATNRYMKGVKDSATNLWTPNPYCTGDTQMSRPEGDGSTVVTEVTVRGPSADPFIPLDGPVLCKLVLPGWNRDTTVAALGNATTPTLLARTYHRWANILEGGLTPGNAPCPATLSVKANEDYSIQVQTIGGGGQNRFALRASLGDKIANEGVSIFAVDQVSLFNNVPTGVSRFNFVRLENFAKGQNLNVRFYDLGDAEDGVTATLLQPDDVPPITDSPYATCTGTGPVSGTLTPCSLKTTATVNGGRWQEIKIRIPATYTCADDDDQSKCWVRVKLETTKGQADTTTWAADLEGDPVRLVE